MTRIRSPTASPLPPPSPWRCWPVGVRPTTRPTPPRRLDAGRAAPPASASAGLCSSFASLKTDAADLASTKVDTTRQRRRGAAAGRRRSRGKADKVRDDLNTMMMESNGGPAAAVIGALNKKADALKAQLTVAKTDAQEDLGPKITAAQSEITTALEPVSGYVGQALPLQLTHTGSLPGRAPSHRPAAPPVPRPHHRREAPCPTTPPTRPRAHRRRRRRERRRAHPVHRRLQRHRRGP